MANTNTDLTEEDAADMLFRKESVTSSSDLDREKPVYLNSLNSECFNCDNELCTPYIMCVVCNVNICSSCFANGAEFLNHKNDHDYSIFDDNSVLFQDSNWSAKEELVLLSTLLEYGNFNVVTRYLPNRSARDVKEHYDLFYLEKHGSDLLPSFPKVIGTEYQNKIVPYQVRLNNLDEPPRYTPNSVGFHLMAGYNAARSEFELEYDSNAEDLISNLNFKPVSPTDPHYKLITDLQCTIIRSYNRRLAERQRRKAIIRNHGLILVRKTNSWLHRYDMSITRRVYERMCRFMQFYTGMQFEFLMEGLHCAGELKAEISRLCEFHKRGITTLQAAQLYLRLKQAHEQSLSDVKLFQNNTQFNWKIKHSLASAMLLPACAKKRGFFSPLDVVGLPGYEKLTAKEQELCRTVRLVPLSYVEFRDILINESKKAGYLKLQTARRLLKIDVNKTRRLYDFLIEEGYINKP